jgi:putative transposase
LFSTRLKWNSKTLAATLLNIPHLASRRFLLSSTREARKSCWSTRFVHWYNVEHRHSGIRYVSLAQRHAGEDQAILAARQALYASARDLNPARWSGKTRNWTPVGPVTLNPERDCITNAHSQDRLSRPSAA